MFVHASHVSQIAARHPEIKKARIVVTSEDNTDQLTLRIEVDGADASIAEAVTETVRDVTKLRGAVEIVEPGSLPDDGRVVEDARSYE